MFETDVIVDLTTDELDEYAQFMKEVILKTSGTN